MGEGDVCPPPPSATSPGLSVCLRSSRNQHEQNSTYSFGLLKLLPVSTVLPAIFEYTTVVFT